MTSRDHRLNVWQTLAIIFLNCNRRKANGGETTESSRDSVSAPMAATYNHL